MTFMMIKSARQNTGIGFKIAGVVFIVSLLLTLSCRASMDIRNGELLPNSQLELKIHDESGSRIKPGSGSVIRIEAESERSFFRTDHRYAEELLIGVPAFPSEDDEMTLPDKEINILYQAGIQFVVFRASTAEGRIVFDKIDQTNKQASGTMRLKMKNELQDESFEKEVQLDFRFTLKIGN